MSQSFSWARVASLAIPAAVFIIGTTYAVCHSAPDAPRPVATTQEGQNQELLHQGRLGAYIFADNRNTTMEALANSVLATRDQFIVETAYVIQGHPEMTPEQAAGVAYYQLRDMNRSGQTQE